MEPSKGKFSTLALGKLERPLNILEFTDSMFMLLPTAMFSTNSAILISLTWL